MNSSGSKPIMKVCVQNFGNALEVRRSLVALSVLGLQLPEFRYLITQQRLGCGPAVGGISDVMWSKRRKKSY